MLTLIDDDDDNTGKHLSRANYTWLRKVVLWTEPYTSTSNCSIHEIPFQPSGHSTHSW
jgi:hypothetical protein